MHFKEWLALISPDSVRGSALKAGISPRTLAAQLDEERLSPESVIALARAYQVSPLSALIDVGYMTADEAEQDDIATSLYRVPDEALAAETLRRMKSGPKPRFIPQQSIISAPNPNARKPSTNMLLKEWLKTLPGSPTPSQAANHAGVPRATVLRHAEKEYTTAEIVIGIARGYGHNPVRALVEVGMITQDEAENAAGQLSLAYVRTGDLLKELSLRLADDGSTPVNRTV